MMAEKSIAEIIKMPVQKGFFPKNAVNLRAITDQHPTLQIELTKPCEKSHCN